MKISTLLILLILSFSSCKKESLTNDLSDVVLNNKGILRVECNDCQISYSIQNKDYNVSVKDGSEDIAFFYVTDFNLKTQVKSLEEQGIRLMIIDSYGRVVSNELSSFSQGQVREGSFRINAK
jgi:predicted ATP-dependent serine protease